LLPKSAKSCEILQKFELVAVQALRSSKVIDLGATVIEAACNFLLVINSNFGRISYRFRDIDIFSLQIARFLRPPLFDAPP